MNVNLNEADFFNISNKISRGAPAGTTLSFQFILLDFRFPTACQIGNKIGTLIEEDDKKLGVTIIKNSEKFKGGFFANAYP